LHLIVCANHINQQPVATARQPDSIITVDLDAQQIICRRVVIVIVNFVAAIAD
jgi:hypothetical protein